MKISSVDAVTSSAKQISFSITDHLGAVFRIVTNFGYSAYFKASSTPVRIPLANNMPTYNKNIMIEVDMDSVKVLNPNSQSLNVVLEVYEDRDANVHTTKVLDLYDLQVIRYVAQGGSTASLNVESANVVGNEVKFSTQLAAGTYNVYCVTVGGFIYDVNSELSVTQGDPANLAVIPRFVTVYD